MSGTSHSLRPFYDPISNMKGIWCCAIEDAFEHKIYTSVRIMLLSSHDCASFCAGNCFFSSVFKSRTHSL